MKSTYLSLLLMFSTLTYSQNLDRFLGIRFGTTLDSVKKIMLIKPNCKLDLENSTNDKLLFTGVQFAGRETLFISFLFVNNKFHTGTVILSPRLESQIVELFNDIKSELNEKYFHTTSNFESYDYPYEKDDGHTETAIKLGKANFSSFWSFKNPKSEKEDDKNVIALSITENMVIKVQYQDGVLINEAIEISKKKNYQDY